MTAEKQRGQRANITGNSAEDAATRHYLKQGYEILERRYRAGAGEIDLIVKTQNLLVFVEVKSRHTVDEAAQCVSPGQWQRILQTALTYCSESNQNETHDMRVDLFAADQTGQFQIYENVTQHL